MKVYHGHRFGGPGPATVMVTAPESCYLLPFRLDLFGHSPEGFQWGYGGSGPAQLALAVLADATESDALAVHLHQAFKREWVAGIDCDHWGCTEAFVLQWAVKKLWALYDAERGGGRWELLKTAASSGTRRCPARSPLTSRSTGPWSGRRRG